MTQLQLFHLVSKSLNGKNPSWEVLLSWIPRNDPSGRNLSLVRFFRIDPSEHEPTLLEIELKSLLNNFDIENIFETEKEANLFLQSIGRRTVPARDFLDPEKGSKNLNISKDDPLKPIEFAFYEKFRPETPLEMSTLLPEIRCRRLLKS